MKMSDEEAARIQTVGQAVDFVLAHRTPTASRGPDRCARSHDLLERCRTISPGRRSRTPPGSSGARTPTSGSRSSATRVLGWRSRRTCTRAWRPSAYGAGRLTKIRAQAVSGRSCRDGRRAARASRSGCAPRRRRRSRAGDATRWSRTERVLASVIEAVIGACYLRVRLRARPRRRWSRRSRRRSSEALEHPADFKSALQERLARRGDARRLRGDGGGGPAARADLRGRRRWSRARSSARGLGRSQEGRRAGGRRGGARRLDGRRSDDAPEVDHPQGLQVVPRPHAARVLARRVA